MLFDDTYLTIGEASEGIYKDKGSKFLAYAYPIKSPDVIKELVAFLKAEHPKARHYCWALRWSTDRSVFRINDDGEPSGTAGRPILNTLLSKNVTNVAIIVVRYFGGTLLGVTGLINAYKSAAEDVINNSSIIKKTITDVYGITFDYSKMNAVMKLIKNENLAIIHQVSDTVCQLQVGISRSEVYRTLELIGGITNVKVSFLFTV